MIKPLSGQSFYRAISSRFQQLLSQRKKTSKTELMFMSL